MSKLQSGHIVARFPKDRSKFVLDSTSKPSAEAVVGYLIENFLEIKKVP